MLTDYLTEDVVELNVDATDWQDALKKAGQLLVNQDKIDMDYIKAMIDAVEEYGPYIAISPHIALGHAAPGPYVKEDSISLVTLKNPIEFGHEKNDPIRLLFIIAATDHDGHLSFLQELAMILSDPDKLSNILNAKSKGEVMALL
ncbi:MAG: PTS sugar transporter subunit IIA [Bacillota bacterium]